MTDEWAGAPALSIVFAGGGCRTVWGVGALEALDLPRPREWAGVSAGSAMSLVLATGRQRPALDVFLRLAADNPRNVYPDRFFEGRPVFPHETMYRATLAAALEGGGYESMRAGPPVRVQLASVEPGPRGVAHAVRAMLAYQRRRRAGEVHGPPEPEPGVASETATLQDAESREEVIDQVIASSATWPVTRLPRRNGRVYVDGGLVENVPVRALSPEAQAGRVLVLLSRAYDRPLPEEPGRLYLAPTHPIPVQKWDYTNPDAIRATLDLGRADGEAARPRVRAFLEAALPA